MAELRALLSCRGWTSRMCLMLARLSRNKLAKARSAEGYGLMAMLVRIAVVVPSTTPVGEDVEECIRLLARSCDVEPACACLVNAVRPQLPLDKRGRRLQLTKDSREVEMVEMIELGKDCVEEDMEKRAHVIVKAISSCSKMQSSNNDNNYAVNHEKNNCNDLAASFFRLCWKILVSHLSSTSKVSRLPEWTKSPSSILAAISILVALVDNCGIDSLIKDGHDIIGMLTSVLTCHVENITSNHHAHEDDHDDDDKYNLERHHILQPITSLATSILVAVLELDTTVDVPEKPSLILLLELLSVPCPQGTASDAHLAEMASHALSLLVAGTTAPPAQPVEVPHSSVTLAERVAAVHSRLEGEEVPAPLRAAAVVELRHMAQAHEAQRLSCAEHPLAEEVGTEAKTPKAANVLEPMLHACLVALGDAESYVYLAAVSTMAALGDVEPARTLTVLGSIVGQGIVELHTKNPGDPAVVVATQAQRAKAAEALTFVIRRRGPALASHTAGLVEDLLFGCAAPVSILSPPLDEIGHTTHAYFITDDETDMDKSAARQRRLQTGGPLFTPEEEDTVRSGCLSALVEVVLVLPPERVAQHVSTLVPVCRDALRLEQGRPVRRAAALLAGALYSSLLAETHAALDQAKPTISLLALELVRAGEYTLYLCLEENADVRMATLPKSCVDHATACRCVEALEARQGVRQYGVLALAGAELERRNREEEALLPHMLKNIWREKEEHMRTCLKENEIDEHLLSFCSKHEIHSMTKL